MYQTLLDAQRSLFDALGRSGMFSKFVARRLISEPSSIYTCVAELFAFCTGVDAMEGPRDPNQSEPALFSRTARLWQVRLGAVGCSRWCAETADLAGRSC